MYLSRSSHSLTSTSNRPIPYNRERHEECQIRCFNRQRMGGKNSSKLYRMQTVAAATSLQLVSHINIRYLLHTIPSFNIVSMRIQCCLPLYLLPFTNTPYSSPQILTDHQRGLSILQQTKEPSYHDPSQALRIKLHNQQPINSQSNLIQFKSSHCIPFNSIQSSPKPTNLYPKIFLFYQNPDIHPIIHPIHAF